jgi:hypothetical protein
METNTPNHNEEKHQAPVPVETNYEAHKDNPGPAPTVNEPDNKGGGAAMKWIIPIVIIILLIVYFMYFRNNVTN